MMLIEKIITKEIEKEITIEVPKGLYGNIEMYTQVQGITVYTGAIRDIQLIKIQLNNTICVDGIKTILHNVQEIHVKRYSSQIITYEVYTKH